MPAVAFSQRLAGFSAVRHGVTVRDSRDTPTNLSFSTSRDAEAVVAARCAVCARMGFALDDLIVPAQVHGANVAVVTAMDRGRGAASSASAVPGCDALVTNAPGILLGITIADCLPVFLYDPVRHAIGIAHSGWRGTAGRIACNVVSAMAEAYGTNPADCIAAIGPGIGPEGYEVDETVYAAFLDMDRAAPGVFVPTVAGHWALDLVAAVRLQLIAHGISDAVIDISPWRTNRDPSLFFSHRQSPGCPRMGAFIGMAREGL